MVARLACAVIPCHAEAMAKKPPPPLPAYVEDALGADWLPRKEITPEARAAYKLCVDLARQVAITDAKTKREKEIAELIADTIEMLIRQPN